MIRPARSLLSLVTDHHFPGSLHASNANIAARVLSIFHSPIHETEGFSHEAENDL
jgi:hypothetical protein